MSDELRAEISAYILADHRENNGAIPFLTATVDQNNKTYSKMPWKSGGGTIIPQILNNGTIGDYCVMVPSRYDPNHNIIAAIFERKTWKDLSASLKDQRAMSQLKNMRQIRDQKGCYIYYIIEGPLTYSDDTSIAHIAFKNLHAKLRKMSIKGVHSFQTRDQQDTARFLVNIARDLSGLYRSDSISFDKQEPRTINPMVNFKAQLQLALTELGTNDSSYIAAIKAALDSIILEQTGFTSLESSPTSTGGIIPSELTTRAVHSNTDIWLSMWCAIPKVSNKAAVVLMQHVNLLELVVTEDTTTLAHTISNLTYTSGMRFGTARAETVCLMAYNGNEPGKVAEAQDTACKILSQIPNVTQDVAYSILQIIPFKKFCSQILSATSDEASVDKNLRPLTNQLADITRKNGKRIGIALAQRIVNIMRSTPDPSQIDLN